MGNKSSKYWPNYADNVGDEFPNIWLLEPERPPPSAASRECCSICPTKQSKPKTEKNTISGMDDTETAEFVTASANQKDGVPTLDITAPKFLYSRMDSADITYSRQAQTSLEKLVQNRFPEAEGFRWSGGRALELDGSTSIGDGVDDDGAQALASVLKMNTALTSLTFRSGNGFGMKGTEALAEALETNTTLTCIELSCWWSGIWGDRERECFKLLVGALEKNATITTLKLSKIRHDEDAKALANVLTCNSILTSIRLTGDYGVVESSSVDVAGIEALANSLRNSTSLVEFSLTDITIREEAAVYLSDALKENKSLTFLHLERNHLGDKGAAALSLGLKSNVTLMKLELKDNDVSLESYVACDRLVQRNKILQHHSAAICSSGRSAMCSSGTGLSFYIDIRDNKSSPTKNDPPSLFWKMPPNGRNARIFEAAVGDGMALKLLHKLLKDVLKCDADQVFGSAVGVNVLPRTSSFKQKKSEKLIEVCRMEGVLKRLVDLETIHEGSNLLHMAAALDSTEALELCKFLVAQVGADFDSITDAKGRSPRSIAMANENKETVKWAQSVGTLFGRYKVEEGRPAHQSATCTVHFALDITKGATHDARDVALKIIKKRAHFERELRMRLSDMAETIGSGRDIPPGSNRFDQDHVVNLCCYHDDIDSNGNTILCLVMPRAERSLDHIIRVERIAGHDLDLIKHFAKDVARALEHLHVMHGIVHGDFKPRNIMRVGSSFKLIDFDASAKIGHPIGTDKKSTGYCPPELGKVMYVPDSGMDDLKKQQDDLKRDLEGVTSLELRDFCEKKILVIEQQIEQLQAGRKEHLVAHPTFDIWSFGVVMYHMLAGMVLLNLDDDDNLKGVEEERQLLRWQGLSNERLKAVLQKCCGVSSEEIRRAKDMLKCCLEPNPDNRPQSMTEVLDLPFLKSSTDSQWTPGERNRINVLFSDPLVWSETNGTVHPVGPRLAIQRERDSLTHCIKTSGRDIDLSFDAATCTRLQELATERCGCLHFSGHGHPSYLIFEDGTGGAHFVSIDDVRDLLISYPQPFKFVFVAACHSENIGEAFVMVGVRHVVCCELQFQLDDDAAADFTRSFYHALAEGYTIEHAFTLAKGRISAAYGHHESNKFVLLPKDGEHDTTVLDADEMEVNDEPVEKLTLPVPPVDFLGREIIMHEAVCEILSQRRLVTLEGPKGIGLSCLASAVCQYINDRLHTIFNIDAIYYVRKNRAANDLKGSLLDPLFMQLSAAGATLASLASADVEILICDTLVSSKALVVFDGVCGLGKALRSFLHKLFEKTSTVKVLIASRERTNFSSSAVVEKCLPVDPLDHASAAELFAKICHHIHTAAQRSDFLNIFFSETSFGTKTNIRPKFSDSVEIICEGVPAKIVGASLLWSEDDCKSFFSDRLASESAVRLFGLACADANEWADESRLRDALFQWSPESNANDSRSIETLVKTVHEGIPSKIIEAAKVISEDEYKALIEVNSPKVSFLADCKPK